MQKKLLGLSFRYSYHPGALVISFINIFLLFRDVIIFKVKQSSWFLFTLFVTKVLRKMSFFTFMTFLDETKHGNVSFIIVVAF